MVDDDGDPAEAVEVGEAVEIGDELPADLDVTAFVGPYTFPDNARRRVQGALYLALALGCVVIRWVAGPEAVLVNDGYLVVAAALTAWGLYCLVAGTRLAFDETAALTAAVHHVGFPVGHASAQLGWRGLRSRPTWRILLYSADQPPSKRGFLLIDGSDGEVLADFVEDNPEDWSTLT